MEYRQRWDDVLFLHWRFPADGLRRFLPPALEVATRDGHAWVSAVVFRLRVRLRWLPPVPLVSNFAEVNVRTYVHHGGRPGIWFLSIHAANRPAARLARFLTPIPYDYRPLRYAVAGDGFELRHPSAVLTFRPTGPPAEAGDGSLCAWLLERYRVFAPGRSALAEAEVTHPRWGVRTVELTGWSGGFGREIGLDLGNPPDAAHFSSGVRADFGSFRLAERAAGVEAAGTGR